MELEYAPSWLLGLDIKHADRWRIIFEVSEDMNIAVFRDRMTQFHMNENAVCRTLDHFVTNANVQHHEGEIPVIDDDSKWDVIFKRLRLQNDDEKNTLKIMLNGIKQSEIGMRMYHF